MATSYLLASLCYNSLSVLFAASTAVSWSFSDITWLPVSELATRLALLVLESLQKTGSMGHDSVSGRAPEETVGLLNATFFWWINRILLKGSHRMLRSDDIPPLDAALKPETLRAAVLRAWDRRGTYVVTACGFCALKRSLIYRQAGEQNDLAKGPGALTPQTVSLGHCTQTFRDSLSVQSTAAHSRDDSFHLANPGRVGRQLRQVLACLSRRPSLRGIGGTFPSIDRYIW